MLSYHSDFNKYVPLKLKIFVTLILTHGTSLCSNNHITFYPGEDSIFS